MSVRDPISPGSPWGAGAALGTSTSRAEPPGWAGGMAGRAFGSQSIVFSTGGEGDGEKEPGEGEVSILVPLRGGRDCPFTCVRRYQAPICLTYQDEPWVLSRRWTPHWVAACWRVTPRAVCAELSLVWWVLGQGVNTNAAVTLTLSFSPAPGDPQVNRSRSPSKCWCIFSGARSELEAVPGQRLRVMGLAP